MNNHPSLISHPLANVTAPNYQPDPTSIHTHLATLSIAQPHIQSKGKEKMQIGSSPTLPTNTPDHLQQNMWISEYEDKLINLKTKLANVFSAAESWRIRHSKEVAKTKSLEEVTENLTADKTALQATVQILEAKITRLQHQLLILSGRPTYPTEVKDIHVPVTDPTPDKGKCQVHFAEPNFDLVFSHPEINPNFCPAITCYFTPKSLPHVHQIPDAHPRTRSSQSFMSAPPPSAQSNLARNYKQFQPFRDLSTQHQRLVENLASRTDLQG